MAALGYAATGYGQGQLARQQTNRDEQYRQQGMELQGRQVGLQERGFDEEKRQADRRFAQGRIERLENRLQDPQARRFMKPGEIDKYEKELDRLYAMHPDFDLRDKNPAPQPGAAPQPEQPPVTADAADLYQVQPPRPGVSDVLPQVTPEQPLPTDPRALGGLQQGPEQFNPMGIRPDMANRPIPNTGQGVPGTGPKPKIAPAAPPPQQQPGPQQGPVSPESLISQLLAEAATAAPAVRDQLLTQVVQLQGEMLRQGGIIAQTDQTRAQTSEIPLEGASVRGLREEQIAASQDDRLKFKPRELQLQEAANELKRLAAMADLAGQKRLAEKDAQELELSLRRYGLSVAQFTAELEDKKLQAAKTGLDIRKMMQEPDFWTKFAAETAQKFGYGQTPYSKQFVPGPGAPLLNSIVPGMGGSPGGGGAPSGQVFDAEAYKRNTKDSPATQKRVLQQMKDAGLLK